MPPTLRELEESRRRAQDSRSVFFRAMEYLNRPHSAISGVLSEVFDGGDPLGAAGRALRGQQQYGGQDVVSSVFNIAPESKTARRAGLAFDILNPLDPLNYVGIGGLSKAGKVARLGERLGGEGLVKGFGEQVAQGQRGLFTFAGRSASDVKAALGLNATPLPGEALAARGLGKIGEVIADSPPGRYVRENLSGRAGAVEGAFRKSGVDPVVGDAIKEAERQAEIAARLKTSPIRELNETILKNLNSAERRELSDVSDRIARGNDVLAEAQQFIGTGPRAAKRQEAFKAFEQFKQQRDVIGEEALQRTGISAFTDPNIGYLGRLVRRKPGSGQSEFEQIVGLTSKKPVFEGQADNPFNKAQVQASIYPITTRTLTPEGYQKYLDNGGEKWFERLAPKEKVDFLGKHRISLEEYDKILREEGLGKVERDIVNILDDEQRQLTANIQADDVIRRLLDQGIAKPWDDGQHLGKNFVRVDQGRYIDNPVAIPKQHADAYDAFLNAVAPSQEKPLIGELMSWWKLSAIAGLIPTGYWSRNVTTGLIKNHVEGMGFGPSDFMQTARLYAASPGLVAKFWDGDLSGVINLKGGRTMDVRWLHQMYDAYRIHGGHLPDVDVLKEGFSKSAELRHKVVEKTRFKKGSEAAEALVRLPLFLKYFEDTLDLAAKRGFDVPNHIGALGPEDLAKARAAGQTVPERLMSKQIQRKELFPEVAANAHGAYSNVIEAGLENGREAVIRAHFDYQDLSPTEQRLRNFWIPFYTWSRKNIPGETRNMITNFGDYMPFVRAYYNSFDQQNMTREDLPEWAQDGFAMPISPNEDGRIRWADFTGFLPFIEPLEAANTVLGEPRPETGGGAFGRLREALRFIGIRTNPFLVQAAEQSLGRSLFTQRAFTGDMPRDIFGQTTSAPAVNLFGLARPASDLDRLNPFDIFGADRPHRNEPEFIEAPTGGRLGRTLTGLTIREADDDLASQSENQRNRKIAQVRSRMRKALREGDEGAAGFYRARLERLQGGL